MPNTGRPKDIKHILRDLKGETDSSIIIEGDFNTPMISMGRSSNRKKKKINKGT